MFKCGKGYHGNCGHLNSGLTSGRPILRAENQFVECHFSHSQFVPFRKVGRRQLKEILRRATAHNSDKRKSSKVYKKKKTSSINEFEMISLSDSCDEEETCIQNAANKTEVHIQEQQQHEQQKQQERFAELLRWIFQEGKEFVHIETYVNLREVFALVDVIARSRNPVLITVLIRDNEPNLITVSLSSVKVDVQCLLFCMFPV